MQLGFWRSVLCNELANRTEPVGLKVEEWRQELGEQGRAFVKQILLQLTQGFKFGRYIGSGLGRIYQTRELFPLVGGHHHCHHYVRKP